MSVSATGFTPETYHATRNEVGVFTTPPYSEAIKPLWRFQDSVVARASAEAIWERFERYRDQEDFVGMDITRKFLQMGRTRSLRYALRPGGRKYSASTGEEMARTGKVYDEEKRKGAGVFEGYLDRCWRDEVYQEAYDEWAKEGKKAKVVNGKGKSVERPERDMHVRSRAKGRATAKRKRTSSDSEGHEESSTQEEHVENKDAVDESEIESISPSASKKTRSTTQSQRRRAANVIHDPPATRRSTRSRT
ncbi:hypothetical protein IAR55_000333 [Kwoniella newhampshirensis]|uniref:Uncharacterized protein n=1 Tax=Kwoniella newhampshirensis TaxID=1651941 RepID=A0AAW0Z6G7_9TREE